MAQAKRIILRLPENGMDYSDAYKPVRLYFEKFDHPVEELNSTRHFVHIQPPSDLPQPNSKIHIVIDLEREQFSGHVLLDESFPHEIYTIRYIDNEMKKFGFKEGAVKDNLLQKIRQFTDELYPWGQSRLDYLRETRSQQTHETDLTRN